MLGNLVNFVVASNSLASEFWQLFAFSPIFLFSQLDPVIEGFPVRTDYLVDSSVSGSMRCLCLIWCDSATDFLMSCRPPWTRSTWLDQGETSRRAHVDPKPASASALASDFIVRARGRKVAVTSASRRLLDFCGSGEYPSRSIPHHVHDFHSANRFLRYFGKSYTLESPKSHDWCILHIQASSISGLALSRGSSIVSEARSLLLQTQILLHHTTPVALRFPIDIDIDLSTPSL